MNQFSAWDEFASVITVLTGCAAVLLAIGCLWPLPRTRRRSNPPPRHVNSTHPPGVSTCGTPPRPLSITRAHLDMQLHRDHHCARKRAAFAALVAAGRITPDSCRQHQRWQPWAVEPK